MTCRCMLKMVPQIPLVSYEDVKDLTNRPDNLIIDVREPSEIQRTGIIPTSINIPLGRLKNELTLQGNPEDFQKKYGRMKPTANTVIIFTCQSGKRAQGAAEMVASLGYTQVKLYKGSWIDWSRH